MKLPLIQSSLALEPPSDYFRGHTPDEICIPRNFIIFSRKSAKELQRRSFDGYPHHRFVLLFNLMTPGTLMVDGIQWRLNPGEGFLVFPYQFHQFIELQDPNILWVFLTFEIASPALMDNFRHRVLNLDTRSRELLQRVIGNYQLEKTERLKRRLTLDLASLINNLREQMEASPRTKTARAKTNSRSISMLNSIQEYLSQNAGTLHSVSKVARHLNMSESNLRTNFRQAFNISLGSYLRNYRAHQAILLMQNPKISLTDIAFELGFTTLSAFSRFFTGSIGSSPRSYRKTLG